MPFVPFATWRSVIRAGVARVQIALHPPVGNVGSLVCDRAGGRELAFTRNASIPFVLAVVRTGDADPHLAGIESRWRCKRTG